MRDGTAAWCQHKEHQEAGLRQESCMGDLGSRSAAPWYMHPSGCVHQGARQEQPGREHGERVDARSKHSGSPRSKPVLVYNGFRCGGPLLNTNAMIRNCPKAIRNATLFSHDCEHRSEFEWPAEKQLVPSSGRGSNRE